MTGIYKITNPNGKVYIGQSVEIERRLRAYKGNKCTGQHAILNSLQKYGFENHFFEVIEECEVDVLDRRERYWQDYYKVLTEGLNCKLTSTATQKQQLSIEARQKISQSKKGVSFSEEHKKALSKSRQGIPRSEETKIKVATAARNRSKETLLKMSEAKKGKSSGMKGKVHTEETREKMRASHSKRKLK